MPSPFPGMNPYLEGTRVYEEFHDSLASQLQRQLNRALPPGYRARLGSEIILREPSAEARGLARRGDTGIFLHSDEPPEPAGTSTLQAPRQTTLPVRVREEESWYVDIILPNLDQRVVTHVEILSPSNKRQDRNIYIDKRSRMLRSDVSLVEIDLLRAGQRMPMADPPEEPWCVVIARAGGQGQAGVWPIGLREELPTVPIPLLAEHGEVPLDLQQAVDEVHDDLGLKPNSRELYDRQPEPPLSANDLAWAESVLAAARA
jgi:hypothetical protein